jgi:aerobic C4-dicarboxylate transport protein
MKFIKHLYVQVLIGIVIGVILGYYSPDLAVLFKPLSDLFIKLIKMLIAPIIFLSLVSGIASMGNIRSVGSIGGAALIYFILTTVLALLIGLMVANLMKPGSGLNIDPATLDIETAKQYINTKKSPTNTVDFVLNIVPSSFLSAFVDGEILQVLFIALMFSASLMMLGEDGYSLLIGVQRFSKLFFNMIHMVMHLAPLAAFAAIAFSIGKFGLSPLFNMAALLLCFYVTCLLFILVILGSILRLYCKINIFNLLAYIKTEIFIVLGTSSSETVLPNLMEKLENLGCEESVVGLVMPVGYSFNLDGTAIYLTMAALFIAQATNTELSYWQQLSLLLIMIISSKGAAGVAGSGFIVLASSLAAIGHVPVAGIVLILGIDRFLSEGRAVTNMIGNSISTIIISTWKKTFDLERAKSILTD